MKKIIVYSMLSLVALALVGCGNSSSSQAIKDLNNQLDRAEKSVESISSQDLSSICRECNTYQTAPIYSNSFNLLNIQNKVSNDVAMQNQIANQLKERIANIRTCLKSGDKKYSPSKIKALKSLTDQISNYSTKLNNCKDDVKSGMKTIQYNQNINHFSVDDLGSGYTSVSNALELRKAYFFNLANTLNQIESIVGENSTLDDQNNDTEKEENTNKTKNINIPDPVSQTQEQNESNSPAPRPVYNYPNQHFRNNAYGYGYNGFNGGYNGGYGYNGYGYNGYGYGYPYNRAFNPSRNTDTYRPGYVNIDTYRWSKRGTLPNGEYQVEVISTEPFEVVDDENEDKSQDTSVETIDANENSSAQKLLDENKKMLKNN